MAKGGQAGAFKEGGSKRLQFGFVDEFRFRTESAANPKPDVWEMDFQPFASSTLKLPFHLTLSIKYNPRLIVPFTGKVEGPPATPDFTLTHRGDVGLTYRVPGNLTVSLRQRFEYGEKQYLAPPPADDTGGDEDPLDAIPALDVIRVLNLTTDVGFQWYASEQQSYQLQLQFVRQGGAGDSGSGLDPRNYAPQVLSPLVTFRNIWWVTRTDAVGVTLQANYNEVSYGSGPDATGRRIDFGGPANGVGLVQLSYVRKLARVVEGGVGVGPALYSTPPILFETDGEEELRPNDTVLMPSGSVWLGARMPSGSHTIELYTDSSLMPKVDRIAGDVNPRIRGTLRFKYKNVLGFYAAGDGNLSVELGDGRDLGPDFPNGYLVPSDRQFTIRLGGGYVFRRWLAFEIGGRLQSLVPQARGDRAPKVTERWTAYANVAFNWDVLR
jgi:hypothetical protein